MKVSVASGKGGTGKTTVSVNLAYVANELYDKVKLCDCDVEAPDCKLFLENNSNTIFKDVTVLTPNIDSEKCNGCGKCTKLCRYNALAVVKDNVIIFPELCHSCGLCIEACENNVFSEKERKIGIIESSDIDDGKFKFIKGTLNIAEVLTTKIIADIKDNFCDNDHKSLNILDCPPGTSCPAIESFLDTDKVILVTEPTPFGLNDLKLAINLTAKLALPVAIVINKSDGEDNIIDEYAKEVAVPIIGRIPFHKKYAEAYSEGKVLVKEFSELKEIFKDIVAQIKNIKNIAKTSIVTEPISNEVVSFTKGTANSYKEITILSGKGGTGKTTISASFAELAQQAVMADTDVDAANLHLLNNAKLTEQQKFYSGFSCQIDNEICINCGKCYDICRFEAITLNKDNRYEIDSVKCEGCGSCEYICPKDAIISKECLTGVTKLSTTDLGPLVHAKLGVGEDNSGKLVTEVRKKATKLVNELQYPLLIVDGPPGIGCPVIASLTDSDGIVLVTEPTVSGLHDLERIIKLIKHFNLQSWVIINKADINRLQANKIKKLAVSYDIEVISEIPFDKNVVKLLAKGKNPLSDANSIVTKNIKKAWNQILNKI